MRLTFAERDRRIIPVLLGFVLLNVCALAGYADRQFLRELCGQKLLTAEFAKNPQRTQRTYLNQSFRRYIIVGNKFRS